MHRIIVVSLAAGLSIGFGAAAFAADLGSAAPAPVYTKAPIAPLYSWTGFYVGGDIGWFGAKQDATTNPGPSPGFGAPAIGGAGLAGFGQTATNNSLDKNGMSGGLYAGYNWQWTTNWVAGVEGDFSWLNRNVSNNQTSSATFPGFPVSDFNMNVSASNHWLASLRGRLGYTPGPALFYVTGGAAWTDTSYSASATGFNNPPNINALAGTSAATSWSDTTTGWVLGGGVDWKLPMWQNWIFRAEYLHYQFPGSSSSMSTLGNGVDVCAPGHCNWAINTSTLKIDTVRAGLSYKFN
jgi:outer membrane immunogenic protein